MAHHGGEGQLLRLDFFEDIQNPHKLAHMGESGGRWMVLECFQPANADPANLLLV